MPTEGQAWCTNSDLHPQCHFQSYTHGWLRAEVTEDFHLKGSTADFWSHSSHATSIWSMLISQNQLGARCPRAPHISPPMIKGVLTLSVPCMYVSTYDQCMPDFQQCICYVTFAGFGSDVNARRGFHQLHMVKRLDLAPYNSACFVHKSGVDLLIAAQLICRWSAIAKRCNFFTCRWSLICQELGFVTDFWLGPRDGLCFAHRPSASSKPRVPPNPVFSSDLDHLFFVITLTRWIYL